MSAGDHVESSDATLKETDGSFTSPKDGDNSLSVARNRDEDERSVLTTQSLPVPEHLLRRPPVLDAKLLAQKEERANQNLLRARNDMQRMRDELRDKQTRGGGLIADPKEDAKRKVVAERKAQIENEWHEKVLEKFNRVEDRRKQVIEERRRRSEEIARQLSEKQAQVLARKRQLEEEEKARKEQAIARTDQNSERALQMKRNAAAGRSASFHGPRRVTTPDSPVRNSPVSRSRSKVDISKHSATSPRTTITRSASARAISQPRKSLPKTTVDSSITRSKSSRFINKRGSENLDDDQVSNASSKRSEPRVKFSPATTPAKKTPVRKDPVKSELSPRNAQSSIKRSKSAPPVRAPEVKPRVARRPIPPVTPPMSSRKPPPASPPASIKSTDSNPPPVNKKPKPSSNQVAKSTDSAGKLSSETPTVGIDNPGETNDMDFEESDSNASDSKQLSDPKPIEVKRSVTPVSDASQEEYKRRLAEKRKEAKEKAEAEEKARIERELEEQRRLEEEERMRIEEYERKEEERRKRDEEEAERRRKIKEEKERKAKEEEEEILREKERLKEQLERETLEQQARLEREQEERKRREEEERAKRKAKFDAIMSKTRGRGGGGGGIQLKSPDPEGGTQAAAAVETPDSTDPTVNAPESEPAEEGQQPGSKSVSPDSTLQLMDMTSNDTATIAEALNQSESSINPPDSVSAFQDQLSTAFPQSENDGGAPIISSTSADFDPFSAETSQPRDADLLDLSTTFESSSQNTLIDLSNTSSDLHELIDIGDGNSQEPRANMDISNELVNLHIDANSENHVTSQHASVSTPDFSPNENESNVFQSPNHEAHDPSSNHSDPFMPNHEGEVSSNEDTTCQGATPLPNGTHISSPVPPESLDQIISLDTSESIPPKQTSENLMLVNTAAFEDDVEHSS